jgi:glycerol dehydrogenase
VDVSAAFLPSEVFSPAGRAEQPRPRVFLSPARYVQGPGVIRGVGRYLSLIKARRAALLMTQRGIRSDGGALLEGLREAGVEAVPCTFHGECSLEEIAAHVAALKTERIDCVIAAGGGKCIDAGKAIAFRLDRPSVIVPTLASNDAPCSALSVIYTPGGVSSGVEFYPQSPAIVVVDTAIVARAPERYLVAGMGDAMATWYEADVCRRNPAAATTVGARPTIASCAIGEACAHNLFEHGRAAADSVASGAVSDALETVVEANTLLSGLGFESGGLAAAHGVAQSLTAIPKVYANHLHGEMVAIGTLAQLMMESRPEEATRVAEFFAKVGLPVHLGQISLDAADKAALDTIVEGTLGFPFVGNMPMAVSADLVRSSVLVAHRLGTAVSAKAGDEPWRRLQKS